MPRKRHGSRNLKWLVVVVLDLLSCLARGMGVEIWYGGCVVVRNKVMPRKRHGSRNPKTTFHQVVNGESCLARGMGVEIILHTYQDETDTSCLARGMGVEICPVL